MNSTIRGNARLQGARNHSRTTAAICKNPSDKIPTLSFAICVFNRCRHKVSVMSLSCCPDNSYENSRSLS